MFPVVCGTIRGWLLYLEGYTQWESLLFGMKNMVGAAASVALWVWLFSRHDLSNPSSIVTVEPGAKARPPAL